MKKSGLLRSDRAAHTSHLLNAAAPLLWVHIDEFNYRERVKIRKGN